MTDRIDKFGLRVARPLHDLIENEALPLTGVASDTFWKGLSDLVHGFGPKNRALLAKRDDLQAQIDAWHRVHRGQPIDTAAYKDFLAEIGYLVPEGPDFQIDTDQRRSRDRQHAGAAARRARHERALCAQRGECALGQPVRRAVRHGRHGRPAAGRQVTARSVARA